MPNGLVFQWNCSIFAGRMNKGQKETISIRILSTTFVVMALAVFKPFGLDEWQWQACVHLLALGAMGFAICMLTDVILKFLVRMPRAFDKGVKYIIRRNLWFQFINTPLVSLGICLYRHFVLTGWVMGSASQRAELLERNQFSLVNFLETLVIIGFCSFTIGLYWRFKFRSRFLAAELEETRLLNEQLKKQQEVQEEVKAPVTSPDDERKEELTLTGTTNDSVSLKIAHLLYIEAVGNYVKICHLADGQVRTDMLRATSKQMEDDLRAYPMIVRCHRAFLVNLAQVEQIVSHAGSMQLQIKYSHDSLPVSRSNMSGIKEAINGGRSDSHISA